MVAWVGNGAQVFVSVGNIHKKAGALNQALRELLGDLGDNDVVMCMDADTVLDDGFIAAGVQRFTSDRALMAIGGLFYGEDGHGILGQLQRNEYVRYSREIRRRRGRGVRSHRHRVDVPRRRCEPLPRARGDLLPGVPGDVYDTAALTEDNELTLAIKSLGGLMASPNGCRVVTELMPTWRNLWTQRLRWQRGALENLGAYGVGSHRAPLLGATARKSAIGHRTQLVLVADFVTALQRDDWVWFPFWLGVGSLFVVDRVVSVWSGGWKARLLAVLLAPELLYDCTSTSSTSKASSTSPSPAMRAGDMSTTSHHLCMRPARSSRASRRDRIVTAVLLVASVLPESLLHGRWFAALSMFVAINTVLYLTLAMIKLFPKAYVSDWVDQRNRRSETRSIYPETEPRRPVTEGGGARTPALWPTRPSCPRSARLGGRDQRHLECCGRSHHLGERVDSHLPHHSASVRLHRGRHVAVTGKERALSDAFHLVIRQCPCRSRTVRQLPLSRRRGPRRVPHVYTCRRS